MIRLSNFFPTHSSENRRQKEWYKSSIIVCLILLLCVSLAPTTILADPGWYFRLSRVSIRPLDFNNSGTVVGQISARYPSPCYSGPYDNNMSAAIFEFGQDNFFPTCDLVTPAEHRYEAATAINSSGKVIGIGGIGKDFTIKNSTYVYRSFLWDGNQLVF